MKVHKIKVLLALTGIVTFAGWVISCTHKADISGLPEVCFEGEVLPVFQNSCAISGCHDGQGGGESRLALNTYAGIMQGISQGNPDASRIYQAIIAKGGEGQMPPGQPLSLDNRTLIRIWIEQGAQETLCAAATVPTDTTSGTGSTFFNTRACFTRDIQPVLVSKCATTNCHDATSHRSGYNFTTYSSTMNAVVAGDPSNSRLYRVITLSSGEDKMPPSSSPQLTSAEIDSIYQWISYGALNETCGETCDTINPVTYSGVIWPEIQTACTGCHSGSSPSGNVSLASYSDVAAAAANGSLMNALKGNGVTLMPPSGSLSTCQIRQFEIWIANGYANN
ncbi:MAG TPA: c-type cytochrome domain-containing protein [Bacteroidales bacterium]|nr:c-type cytochrome domain-containing protein [Bacteroidales bacterium]